MTRSHNRFTALLLAVLMLISNIVPSGAYAVEGGIDPNSVYQVVIEFHNVKEGVPVNLEGNHYLVAFKDNSPVMFAPLPTSFSEGKKIKFQRFYDASGNNEAGLKKNEYYYLQIYRYNGSSPLSVQYIIDNLNNSWDKTKPLYNTNKKWGIYEVGDFQAEPNGNNLKADVQAPYIVTVRTVESDHETPHSTTTPIPGKYFIRGEVVKGAQETVTGWFFQEFEFNTGSATAVPITKYSRLDSYNFNETFKADEKVKLSS